MITNKVAWFIVSLICVSMTFAQDCPILPTPAVYQISKGNFQLDDLLIVDDHQLPEYSKDLLKLHWTNALGKNIVFSHNKAHVVFKRIINTAQDSYTIDIEEKITISYSTEASCFYALQSLFQLIEGEKQQEYVRKCFLSDYANFQWRGIHLDVSRHFFTVEEIKKYIDILAVYKFNTFHWHLTDDQGWRIEIKKYPRLTSIGSIRNKTLIGHASSEPQQFDGKTKGGYYTQEEVKELVKYAAKKYINIVPEIEMPGHATAALAAYPEFGCTQKPISVEGTWGVFEDVFCTKPETLNFLKEILDEVLTMFPSKYIHIGGDEAPKTHWKACELCQKNKVRLGLKNEEELQSYFIRQMDEYLTQKGRMLIGWDEILEGGISPNAAIMSWRGTQGGIEAAEAQHYVVMSPSSHCYFDHYQSDRATEPLAIGGYTPLEKVFAFNPIPSELNPKYHAYILGAQANLWTEYIATTNQLEYMLFPRALALSEVLWSTKKSTYAAFLNKLEAFHLPLLTKKNIHYSKAYLYSKMESRPTETGVEIELSNPSPGVDLQLTDDAGKVAVGASKVSLSMFPNDEVKSRVYAAESSLNGKQLDRFELNLLQHSTLGKEWTIKSSPSTFYPGIGPATLTDGKLGQRPWNGKDWLGFQQERIELCYDFETVKSIEELVVSTLNAPSSWIYLPKRILIRYSKNGKRWKVKIIESPEEMTHISIQAKVKSIELLIETEKDIPAGNPGAGHQSWLFIDEIYFTHP